MNQFKKILTPETLEALFPKSKTDDFFTALLGDADEGAYQISLVFTGNSDNSLKFEFWLTQRPNKCLVCNLTYGLPEVFQRHPVINIKGLVSELSRLIAPEFSITGYELGRTETRSHQLHVIPLTIFI